MVAARLHRLSLIAWAAFSRTKLGYPIEVARLIATLAAGLSYAGTVTHWSVAIGWSMSVMA